MKYPAKKYFSRLHIFGRKFGFEYLLFKTYQGCPIMSFPDWKDLA